MAEKVNLDALIPREDLELTESIKSGRRKDTVSITDLSKESFFLLNLYKPDFQRETTDWNYTKICNFINSFLNNELIPAIILWRSEGGSVFVIDGAHRLSALIAWINDDYGDGEISRNFFGGNIPEEQLILANKTRKYIEKKIKAYNEYKSAILRPDIYNKDIVRTARMLSSAAIQLQWVEGDVSSAEKSFFNINQQGAIINPTELNLIKSRKKPSCISARAIMRMGLGHKYWSNFSEEKQFEIEQLSKEIFELMFLPKLETPVKTLDVSMCGKHNSNSLPVIYEFIKICNKSITNNDNNDITGDATIKYLKQTRKIACLINSNDPSSLGLHPIIYFYAQNGSFMVSAFYAFTLFVMELDEKNKKNIFINHRRDFEDVYYHNSSVVQLIARKYRSSTNGMYKNKDFLFEILNHLDMGIKSSDVMKKITQKSEYSFLPINNICEENSEVVKFNSRKKSEIYIKGALQTALRCPICNGYIHKNAISIDHIERKQDGGKANVKNGQVTHPYCNTGYKN